MTLTIYGIKACDTMKKARAWLEDARIPYEFHDYKVAGARELDLRRWCDRLGWEAVLNRAGTTFRKLPDADKQGLTEDRAIALMVAQPSMIKRPILEGPAILLAGFRPQTYADALEKTA